MKKILLISIKYKKIIKKHKINFDEIIFLKNIENDITLIIDNINKLIISDQNRIGILIDKCWLISSKLMKLKKAIVVNVFGETDFMDSSITNGSNIAIFDTIENSIEKNIYNLKIFMESREYYKDGFHDQYILALKEWG